jgi:hypothetical protein
MGIGINKKGDLTSWKIVSIVLVIAGLIIGVIFFALFFEEKPDRELCRLSVVERASAPVGKDIVSLKCTTEKVCITTKKSEKCKEFAGEENIRYVVLDIPTGDSPKEAIKRDKAVKIIEEETANAMFDCWKMTGEGKLNIFGSDSVFTDLIQEVGGVDAGLAISIVKPKCIVCSRIAISEAVYKKDEEVRKNLGKSPPLEIGASPSDSLFLDNVNVNDYMVRNKVPGSTLTYLQTFTDEGVGGYAEFSQTENEETKKLSSEKQPKRGVSQLAIVFVQMKVSNTKPDDVFKNGFFSGAAIGATAALTGPGKLVTKAAGKFLGPIGWIAEAAAIGAVSYNYASSQEDKQRNNQLLASTVCGKYATNDKEQQKYGCSLTKAMKWEASEINRLCSGGIESNF